MITLREALNGIPALPLAVLKVLEETGKEEPDARVVVKAIEGDVGLASKLLSIVNSATYGLQGVTNLSQAVTVAGMRQVRNVALAVGALRAIPGIPKATLEGLLEKAIATAQTSRVLAAKGGLSLEGTDTAHLGGLLRGVGHLLALRMGIARPTDQEIAYLSRRVLEHWKLPASIVAAVAFSEGPFEEPGPACAVHIAVRIVESRGGTSDPVAMDLLNVVPADLGCYDPRVKVA